MRSRILIAAVLVAPCLVALATGAQPPAVEVSDDGRETVILSQMPPTRLLRLQAIRIGRRHT